MDIDPDNPLTAEILQEMAAAYFAVCRKMVDSLAALKAFDRSITSSTLDPGHITQRAELVEDAAQQVYFVVIQREAMKLAGGEKFFEDYDVPDEVRRRMGPKRLES